ncbi:MAG: hypothetical protein K2X63_10350 [Burkholderiaceae bacterium]|nr:hypothetical protein [Burkholderiaceae bacterium]
MDATLTERTEIRQTTLSKTDQKRLERLAASAGRTPQAMLRYVLRDGFAVCEEDIAESQSADQEFAQDKTVGHGSVMQAAKKLLKGTSKRV